MRNHSCLVARVLAVPFVNRTKHYLGMPPELTGGIDHRREMPIASVLIIEEKQDGIFLFRYTTDRQFVGDTWHQSLDDAKDQAEWEFSGHLSDWSVVPPDVDDPVSFALKQISEDDSG